MNNKNFPTDTQSQNVQWFGVIRYRVKEQHPLIGPCGIRKPKLIFKILTFIPKNNKANKAAVGRALPTPLSYLSSPLASAQGLT